MGPTRFEDARFYFQKRGIWNRKTGLSTKPCCYPWVWLLFTAIADDVRIEQEDIAGHIITWVAASSNKVGAYG